MFLGYPIWWGDMPTAVYTFMDSYDFSDKVVIPFNTHEGSGDGGTYDEIREFEPEATVLEGLAVRGGSVDRSGSDIDKWLAELSY